MALDWCQIFFYLISWEQIDGFWWNFVYAVVWLTHTIFPNFSTLPLIDVNISIFLNIFRSNEWILINCVYTLIYIYICSMLWLIHIIFPNFSTELWPLIGFRIMFKLNILWNNLWIWSNLVGTLIFICQNMRNKKTKYSGGVSYSACNAFISYRRLIQVQCIGVSYSLSLIVYLSLILMFIITYKYIHTNI